MCDLPMLVNWICKTIVKPNLTNRPDLEIEFYLRETKVDSFYPQFSENSTTK